MWWTDKGGWVSKGLQCSWPFVCMNYRCSPPQVAGHGSPSGAPHWGESSGLSAPVSTWELPTPSPPPGLMCPGLRLGFHSAQNEGGGRGARDRTLIPQHVSAEQEGPRGWQPGTGGRPEGRGWGRSPEGVRTWKRKSPAESVFDASVRQFRPRLSEKRVAVGSLHPPPLVSFHLSQGLSAALSLLLAQMVADNCSSGGVWLLPNISFPFLLMSFLSLIIIYLSWS